MGQNPNFYIVTPPYRHSSAGICALHFLAETLNSLGYPTYLVFQLTVNPQEPPVHFMSGDETLYSPERKLTPLVTNVEARELHQANWRDPTRGAVVIYSDTTLGNPLYASRVARYYLNRDGMLGVWNGKNKGEYRIGQSKVLTPAAHSYLHYVQSLVPLLDWIGPEETNRPINLTYVGKGSIYDPEAKRVEGTVEITRDWPKTREELWTLFTHTAKLYTYDALSSTNAEALICGVDVRYRCMQPFTYQELELYETSPFMPKKDLIDMIRYYQAVWSSRVDKIAKELIAYPDYSLHGAY